MKKKAMNFLEHATGMHNIIIGGHPQVHLDKKGIITCTIQESALEAAVELKNKHGGEIVIWLSNNYSYVNFIKKGHDNNKKIFEIRDLKNDIISDFLKVTGDIEGMKILFQEHANGYIKSNLKSKKISLERKKALKLVFTKTYGGNGVESVHAKCKGTAAGFIKMTEKINKDVDSILGCFGCDNRTAHPDLVGGEIVARSILGLSSAFNFAYFDTGKKGIPMIKCG